MKKSAWIIAILILLSQSSFATEYELVNFDDKIEIISPVIGSEGDVLVVKNLYISIRVNEPVKAQIELVKIEKFEIEESILDKVFLNLELTEEEKNQIYAANIARNYFRLKDNLFELQEELSRQVLLIPSIDQLDFDLLENEIKIIENQYNFYENIYNRLFQKNIFEPELLTYEGILPYYERTVPLVDNGEYMLIFSDLNNNILKEVKFIVKSKEVIINEIIENIPLRLIKMIEFMN